MNFILFNGPPRSGKDTAAKIAFDYVATKSNLLANWEKFSYPNKRMFATMMQAHLDLWGNVSPYEEKKGEEIPLLGVSYRQWQIDVSEKFMKPLYGKDIFGRLLLDRCRRAEKEIDGAFFPIFIVSDCGFQIEVDTLKDHNVLLFRMHRDGCTFEGDSRQWVSGEQYKTWRELQFHNCGTLAEMKIAIEHTVGEWLNL